MTVISAWWRSNMPFQRLSGRLSGQLNYYITRWRQEVRELKNERVGDKMRLRKPAPSIEGPQAFGLAALVNEKDTTLMAIRAGVNILQFSNSLSHANQIKWEVYFSKNCVTRRLHCLVLRSQIHEYGHVRNGWNGHRILITIEHIKNIGI